MKKFISVFLTIVLLLLPMSNTIATAAETPQIAVDTVNAARGEEVEVKVSLQNNTGIASLKLKVAFDSDLKLKSVVYNEALGGQSMLPQKLDPSKTDTVVPISGPVVLNWYNGVENTVGDTVFATLTFVVDENASFGSHNITLTYNEDDVYCLAHGTEENIDLSVVNGKIRVIGEESPKIVLDDVTGIRGEETEVNISLRNNTGIASLKLLVSFDSDLKLKSVVYNDALGGQKMLPQLLDPNKTDPVVPIDSPVILNWYNGIENTIGDMVFATLTFVIDENASLGEHEITLSYDEDDVFCFSNETEENIDMAVIDGCVNVVNTHTVTFKNYDGTVLKEQVVEHGSAATAPAEEPAKENYHFTGWDKDFSNVTGDLVVTAQFAINTHTVTFKNYDGTTLKTQTVDHGSAATAPDEEPTKENYHFIGWDKDFSNITGDIVVTAQFEIDTYTVIFKNWDGTILEEATIKHGDSAAAPVEEPTKESYHFIGWDKSFDNITEDITVTAQFAINTYTVTFKNYDGTVLKEQVVDHGSAATAPDVPERQHYAFSGWDNAFNNVTSDLVITATYNISHTYVETVDPQYLKSEADCVSAAVYYKSCSICGEKSEETFTYGDKNLSNHIGGTHVENAVAATITAEGYTGDTVCDSCGAVITEGSVIAKLDPANATMVYASNKTTRAGKTVTVDIMLKNNPGINHLALDFTYDSAVLTLTGVTPTNLVGTCQGVQDIENVNGNFGLSWENATDATANGTLVTLSFTVKDSAEVGDYDVLVSIEECGDQTEEDVKIYAEKFTINVVDVLVGDVNGDGKIDGRDATRLLQRLANWNVEYVDAACDCNGDGKVDGRDATRLLQWLAGWDVKLGEK